MTKILYIVGTASRNNNQELKWSLRSLEQNALDEVEPVIVGAVPEWFKGAGLECGDPYQRKEKNIGYKIMTAIDRGLVEGQFQISADDHFWMRPTIFGAMPIYFRQDSLPKYEGGNNYAKALDGTRTILLAEGYPIINTTVHCNQWVNADDINAVKWLNELAGSAMKAYEMAHEYGMVQWALWPNVAIGSGRKPRRPIVWKRDIKIGNWSEDELAKVMDEPVWSCNDDAFLSKEFIGIMEERFGKKCRWEK